MNRALFSGVAGLKAHQTKMDVTGNNIANVNTYGYKSQRVIFSDVMYQTLTSASEGTSTTGGKNPSTVGYGSTVASIQTNTSQSSMQSTSFGTDCAITGEGFFQVMDAGGNTYYTKAGNFIVDANGYLVDSNGSFVLGAATKGGDPDSQKIQVTNVGSIPAAQASATFKLNGIEYQMKAANAVEAGNVGFSFTSSSALASGLKAKATISSTGAISITFNANEKFNNLTEVNDAINAAITAANNGAAHKAGNFTLSTTDSSVNLFASGALTGADLVNDNFGTDSGSITIGGTGKVFGKGSTVSSVSNTFSGTGTMSFSAAFNAGATAATSDDSWTITATDGTRTYSATIDSTTTASTILFKRTLPTADSADYFEMTAPTVSELSSYYATQNGGTAPNTTGQTMTAENTGTVTASKKSTDIGLKSASCTLKGGTEGGAVDLSKLSVSVSSDGKVYATNSELGTVEVGAVSLANFANPQGLEQVGSTYFASTVNSGDPELCTPGKDGTGSIKTSALEMSNVDLSSEMADMVTTQRGFQACARVITVSDTMLEELVNLKR